MGILKGKKTSIFTQQTYYSIVIVVQNWIEIEINYNQVFVNGTNYLFEVNERQDNKEDISCLPMNE